MILCENIYSISRNAQYKDLNRITIENQQCRSICIMNVNYSLKVKYSTLQVSFVYRVKKYSSHQSEFVNVHLSVNFYLINTVMEIVLSRS